jgi:hypothetical protein
MTGTDRRSTQKTRSGRWLAIQRASTRTSTKMATTGAGPALTRC